MIELDLRESTKWGALGVAVAIGLAIVPRHPLPLEVTAFSALGVGLGALYWKLRVALGADRRTKLLYVGVRGSQFLAVVMPIIFLLATQDSSLAAGLSAAFLLGVGIFHEFCRRSMQY